MRQTVVRSGCPSRSRVPSTSTSVEPQKLQGIGHSVTVGDQHKLRQLRPLEEIPGLQVEHLLARKDVRVDGQAVFTLYLVFGHMKYVAAR